MLMCCTRRDSAENAALLATLVAFFCFVKIEHSCCIFCFVKMDRVKLEDKLDMAHKRSGADKQERATVEQVIDPKTRILLFKLITNSFISELFGCMSTVRHLLMILSRARKQTYIMPRDSCLAELNLSP